MVVERLHAMKACLPAFALQGVSLLDRSDFESWVCPVFIRLRASCASMRGSVEFSTYLRSHPQYATI
jgi:hypothetical protein